MNRPVRTRMNDCSPPRSRRPLMAGAAKRRVHVRHRGGEPAEGERAALDAARGTPVDAGDRVTTGANGMAQLTMVDQARLSLRPRRSS